MRRLASSFRLAVAIAIAASGCGVAHAKQASPPLPELQFAAIQAPEHFVGDRWSYMEAGRKNAPVIVALHGIGDNSMQWREQFAGLSDRFRVIAWNAPGYMLSDGLKAERPSCSDYANALKDFLDALELEQVHLLGNSFGSRVAQCFAMHFPQRVGKMVFVGPSAGRDDMTEQEKQEYLDGRRAQIAQGGYHFPGNRVSRLLSRNSSPEMVERVSYAMRATNPRAFMQAAYFVVGGGYAPATVGAKVSAPLLLIAGEDDMVSPPATNAVPLHQAVRGSRLIVLKGIGHLPQVEDARTVNKLVREFLLSR